MAAIPGDVQLNEMAQVIADARYADLSPDNRVKIMQLCIDNERNEFIADIEAQLRTIAEWFEKSKLWEGRLV